MDKSLVLAAYPIILLVFVMVWVWLLVVRKNKINLSLKFLGLTINFSSQRDAAGLNINERHHK